MEEIGNIKLDTLKVARNASTTAEFTDALFGI